MSRPLLILDLDDTLLHARFNELEHHADFLLESVYWVYKRPHLEQFLDFCFSYFKVGIWTSAETWYVQNVVPKIVKYPEVLEFIWTSDDCDWYMTEGTLKNLDHLIPLGYDLKATWILDSNVQHVKRHYSSVLPISVFKGDPNDRELLNVMEHLNQMLPWIND